MKKIIIQGVSIILMFLITWFLFSRINWMDVLNIPENTLSTEKKLGHLFWDVFKKSEKENKDALVVSSIDSIVYQICTKNGIDKAKLKVHVLENSEINAFALPDGHLVLNRGLICYTMNQEELCGVICHELAHIQLNHVMTKLIKEIGLSVVISMAGGNSGAQIIKETAKMLSSTAYDRKLEKDADLMAIQYLIKAGINPKPYADILFRISQEENQTEKQLLWLSTHPDTEERAKSILKNVDNRQVKNESVLSAVTWGKLKDELGH